MNKLRENKRGITLIALVITIIVILILAGIVISTLTSNNGILEKTRLAMEEQEIARDKEIIKLASGTVIMDNILNGKKAKMYRDDENRASLELQIKNDGYNVKVDLLTEEESEEYIFKVKFNESGRIYHVNENGDASKVEGEENDGDDKDGILPFIEETGVYAIYKIEDLVELSNKVNNPEESEEIHAKLMNDLDFEDPNSYYNKDRTDFGDLNSDGTLKGLMAELTERTNAANEGFIPIGDINTKAQDDSCKMREFDGNQKKIDNLYIKTNKYEYVGLFGCITECKDLTVSGEICVNDKDSISISGVAGYSKIMENITNKANITASNVNLSNIAGVVAEAKDFNLQNINNNSVIDVKGNNNGISGVCDISKDNDIRNDGYINEKVKNSGEIRIDGTGNECGGIMSSYGSFEIGVIQNIENNANIYLSSVSSENIVGGLCGNASEVGLFKEAINRGFIEDSGISNCIGSIFGVASHNKTESEIRELNIRSGTDQQCAGSLTRMDHPYPYKELENNHFYSFADRSGACMWCSHICDHDWISDDVEGGAHDYHVCTECWALEEHDFDPGMGICTVCNYPCPHDGSWEGGFCEYCGAECQHMNTYINEEDGNTYCGDCGQQVNW